MVKPLLLRRCEAILVLGKGTPGALHGEIVELLLRNRKNGAEVRGSPYAAVFTGYFKLYRETNFTE